MKAHLSLSLLLLVLCQGIFFNQVQSQGLTALDFEEIENVLASEGSQRILAEITSTDFDYDARILSEESSTGEQGENTNEEEAGSTDPGSDIVCSDENCDTCSSAAAGACETCKTGFEIYQGSCQTPDSSSDTQVGAFAASVRYEGDYDEFKANDGENKFIAGMAKFLNIKPSRINVKSAKPGSIIIAYEIYVLSSDTLSVAQLRQAVDTASKNNDPELNFFGGVGILNYFGSNIAVSEGGCPAGYWTDGDICQPCAEGCDTCTNGDKCNKTNVGAIVGGVLGGIALILIIVVGYMKRDVLLKGCSSLKRDRSGAYAKADNQA